MWLMTEAQARMFLTQVGGRVRRAVVISSCDVYRNYGRLQGQEPGPPDPEPLTEDSPLRESRYLYRHMKNTPLDCAEEYEKILVEETLRGQMGLPGTILRYPAVYGPNDYHRFGPWLARMVDSASELKIDENFARWCRTHGFAEDVAEAVILAATNESAAGRTYNVGEPVTPTWAERLEELGRVAGWTGRIVPVPTRELPEPMRTHHDYSHPLAVDTTRIRGELGYSEVTPREEALRRTIAWERGWGSVSGTRRRNDVWLHRLLDGSKMVP